MSEDDKIERTGWYGRDTRDGRFNRQDSAFRNWVTPDGSPGPSGTGGFAAAPGRYHLYVSWACPWAHRTLIYRKLKGLTDQISISVVNPFLGQAPRITAPLPRAILPVARNGRRSGGLTVLKRPC